MPGETEVEIENGTQEVVADVKQEAVPPAKQEVVTEVKQEVVPPVKQEVVADVKQEIVAEEKQETVPPVTQEIVPPVKEEVVIEVKQEEKTPIEPPTIQQNGVPKKEEEAPVQPIIQQNGTPKKNTMSTGIDTESVRAAYDDVRSDTTDTQWAVFKFDGSRIVSSATGADFQKFREQFRETERAFGYIRIQTGDELSKRQKFLFVTWVGSSVSVLQRAKMSTDKSVVKSVLSNFAVELQLENASEIDLGHFVAELNKAGGANYGTGVREI